MAKYIRLGPEARATAFEPNRRAVAAGQD
jgi:hypothetical protein